MNTDGERLQVEFHNKASQVFVFLVQQFETASRSVNRNTHEYNFQQLKKDFVKELGNKLRVLAMDILGGHGNEKGIGELNPILQQLIREYLHRFVQKIDAF